MQGHSTGDLFFKGSTKSSDPSRPEVFALVSPKMSPSTRVVEVMLDVLT